MKTNSNFSKIILFTLALFLSYSFAYTQGKLETAIPEITKPADQQSAIGELMIATEVVDCRYGGSQAHVYHPKLGYVFDSRRYQVTWYDTTGKLVGTGASTPDCICGRMLFVTVRDIKSGQEGTGSVIMAECFNDPF